MTSQNQKKSAPTGFPDEAFYDPLFSPWLGFGDFDEYYALGKENTLVSADRCFQLISLAKQASHLAGDWFECGVYKGGTAIMLSKLLLERTTNKRLFLFDTFEGMPNSDEKIDWHKQGDLADTSLAEVKSTLKKAIKETHPRVEFIPGLIPNTFSQLTNTSISFAHIDVDIYKSVIDCCEFIYPRLVAGGILLFDDYGFPTCPGTRKAVDEFFRQKKEEPLILPTGQAVVFKCP